MKAITKYWFLEGFSLFEKLGMPSMMKLCDHLEMEYIDKGSIIDLSVNSSNGLIHISFKDYGPGMSEIDKKRAFKMFQKLSAQPTDGESSHGLGLAIVKTLVEKLEGSIKIQSTLGQGTAFNISLPEK